MMDVTDLRARLLAWYDACARVLPWRVGPRDLAAGVRPEPYRVWLSEVMLQQTTTAHAAPYFKSFTTRWPTVGDLAAVEDGELMAAWAGLGYYARARNLLACARAVEAEYGGLFPSTEEGLRALPGVGGYTAAAVAAIAFDEPANVVDGNVERVVARLFAVATPVPGAKPELKQRAGSLVTADRPGDWAQALMDLGATVCIPRRPLCDRCPVSLHCAGFALGAPERFPVKGVKAERPRRYGTAFVLLAQGAVALERRSPHGLLGGMLALPTSDWGPAPAPATPPVPADWRAAGEIEHVFTHFPLTLQVWRAEAPERTPGLDWRPVGEAAQALPTVFRKALNAALSRLV